MSRRRRDEAHAERDREIGALLLTVRERLKAVRRLLQPEVDMERQAAAEP